MTDALRALTVRQPNAWSIVYAGKVENRSRNVAGRYRGPVAIHAGLTTDGEDAPIWDLPAYLDALAHAPAHAKHWVDARGAVIGIADLVDVHEHSTNLGCWRGCDNLGWVPADGSDASEEGWAPRVCSPWAMSDHFHLVFENPRALATPVPARGRLGLWRPDGDLAAAIWAQVGEAA